MLSIKVAFSTSLFCASHSLVNSALYFFSWLRTKRVKKTLTMLINSSQKREKVSPWVLIFLNFPH